MNGILDEKTAELSEKNASSRADETSRDEEDVINATEAREQERGNALSKTQSRKSEIDPFGQPPDGGLNAWLKVLGCFLMYSNIWYVCISTLRSRGSNDYRRGFTLTFGAFQNYYQQHFLSHMTPSAISWIGTTQSFLLLSVGCLTGPLFDLGYFRSMLFLGNFLVVFGLFMLSLAREYYQIFLAQAVCIGLGAGLLYIPSLALIGLSFSTKRSIAQGITTAGIAVGKSLMCWIGPLLACTTIASDRAYKSAGGISYILAFDHLSRTKGFGWAVRTMGFISLGICTIAFPALLRGTSALTKARTARKLWDPSAFKERTFFIFTACSFTTYLGYIVPYFFISLYAQDVLGTNQNTAMNILVIAIACSFFGRLISGMVAFKLGPIFTWFWCAASSGIVSLAWMAVRTRSDLYAWSAFWGFCSAGLVTLPAAVFPGLCPDLRRLGTRTGMSWGLGSVSSLIGSPIAGAMLTRTPTDGFARSRSDFLGPQLWAGCSLLVGASIIFVLWTLRVREKKSGYFI